MLAVIMSSCLLGEECESGKGALVTTELDLDPIESISFGIAGNLIVKEGAQQQVEVTAQQNMIDILRTDVQGGIWNIGFTKCNDLFEAFTITVTLPTVKVLALAGAGQVTMEDTMTTDSFDALLTGSGIMEIKVEADDVNLEITGSGTLNAQGSAETQDVILAGSGTIDSYNLPAKTARITVSGSGDVFVDISEQLDVIITGSGNVTYRSDPVVNADIIGTGEVFKAN